MNSNPNHSRIILYHARSAPPPTWESRGWHSFHRNASPRRTVLFPRFSDGAHARGHPQRGGDGRENADDHLYDEFPSLFLHSRLVFVNVLVDWLRAKGRANAGSLISPAQWLRIIRRRFVIICPASSTVLGQFADAGLLRHLFASESSRTPSPQVGTLHVGSCREIFSSVCRRRLDACREDAEVRNLHRLAFQHQLAYAVHHVGEHALDDALGVRRVVVSHVCCQVLKRHGLSQGHGASVPFPEVHRASLLVLILAIENTHSRLVFVSVCTSVN